VAGTGTRGIRDRLRSGVLFPLAVFAGWRIAQFLLGIAFGGHPFHTAFQWDGHFYERIFESGYRLGRREGTQVTAFFPGLTWLSRAVDLVAPSGRSAELLTVNLAAAAAFITVWGVAKAWRGVVVARRAVLLLALFPSSLFLWSFYSEGLFIALGAGAVWADRRDRRWVTALLLVGVSTTRTIGITVGLVLVICRVWRNRRVDMTTVAYAAATGLGLLAVMGAQWSDMGDPLSWMSAQKYWGRELSVPVTWLTDGVSALIHRDQPQRILDLFAVGGVTVTVVYAWLARRDPWPLEARLLPIAFLIVPLCTPTPESSLNRFVLVCWPSFVIGADMVGRGPRWARGLVYLGAGAASVVFARYWAHGKFLG